MTTFATHTEAAEKPRYRDWRSCLGAWAILLVAVGLVVADAPAWVRVVALPVLTLVPGVAVVRLLHRRRPAAVGDPDWAPLDRAADPTLRTLLSVLIGMLLMLPIALLLNTFGVALTPTSMALSTGALGIVLVGAATWFVPVDPTRSAPRQPRRRMRQAAALTAGALAVTAAFGVAVAISHQPEQPYTTLSFLDRTAFTPEGFTAPSGGQVRLNWVLNTGGSILDAGLTSVVVEVDGAPVPDLALDLGTVTATSTGSTLTGSAMFAAPTAPGRHTVRMMVSAVGRDGSAVPQPGFLTTTLEVAP